MSPRKKISFVAGALLLTAAPFVPAASPNAIAPARGAELAQLPMYFEVNLGQAEGATRFLARGPGCQFFVQPTEAVLQLNKVTAPATRSRLSLPAPDHAATFEARSLRLKFLEANPAAQVTGEGDLPGKVNYFVGNDPAKWQAGVSMFSRVRVTELYRGINVVYYGNQHRMEYDFVVAPKADPGVIAIHFDGADRIRLDEHGDLLLTLGANEICQPKPILYQTVRGARKEISGGYQLAAEGTVKFTVGEYDPTLPLVIDPVLRFSTYFGGSGADVAWAVALDPSGNIYVAGESLSANLPTGSSTYTNKYSGSTGYHGDAFVTKLDNRGTNIIYRTYLGGTVEDVAFGLAVDADGNAYLAGYTDSPNFPVVNAISNNIGGSPIPGLGFYPQDGFVAKVGPFGTNLLYSTFLGGSDVDFAYGIALDGSGNVCVSGYTLSTNFPIRNALQTNYLGGRDAFALKIDTTGTNLIYSTFLGGSNEDVSLDVAADAAGNAYVTGYTGSTNFPTANAFQSRLNNLTNTSTAFDAFLTKISPSGNAWSYSTYLGGTNNDFGFRVTVDGGNNVYVAGSTASGDFPGSSTNLPSSVAKGGFDMDAFVVKLDPSGTNRVYSFMLGGTGAEQAWDVAVDLAGHAHFVGDTTSTDLPTTNTIGYLRSAYSGVPDAFVAELNSDGTALVQSAYLGGSRTDLAYGVAVDTNGNAYVVGETDSSNFPIFDARQTTLAGSKDAFLAMIGGEISFSIAAAGTNVVLSWSPFGAANYGLVTRTNVLATNWTAVPNQPLRVADRLTVTLPATNPAAYFNLFPQ